MTKDEQREHAERLIRESQDYDFSFVYEDERLMDESEEDLQEIHRLMHTATVTVGWEESK